MDHQQGVAGHPRACGENDPIEGLPFLIQRAIPARAGRTSGLKQKPARRSRAIPARAGRTLCWEIAVALDLGPSPRVRGEPAASSSLLSPFAGPSPRVRGELRIPSQPGRCRSGHPRACGENPGLQVSIASIGAGHPRACGENIHRAPEQGATLAVLLRAIPARAGRTPASPTT